MEDIELILNNILERLEALERTPIEQRVDHSGIEIGAGDGLQGGGTIDHSFALAIDLERLPEGDANRGNEKFPFFNPTSRLHETVDLETISRRVMQIERIPEQLLEIRKRISQLERDFQFLSLWERLSAAEATIRQLEMKAEDE